MAPKKTWREREKARAEMALEKQLEKFDARVERPGEEREEDGVERDIIHTIPGLLQTIERSVKKQADAGKTALQSKAMDPTTPDSHGIKRLPDGEGEPRNEDTIGRANLEKELSNLVRRTPYKSFLDDPEAPSTRFSCGKDLHRSLIMGNFSIPEGLNAVMMAVPSASRSHNGDRIPLNFSSSTKADGSAAGSKLPKPGLSSSAEPASSQKIDVTTSDTTFVRRDVKPSIVGIYGISGCGKSYLIKQLKDLLGEDDYAFHDGSGMIDSVVPGGLEAFKGLPRREQDRYRVLAIKKIRDDCAKNGKVGIVAGHYMFWKKTVGAENDPTDEGQGDVVWTADGDAACFTHMLYLDVLPIIVAQQCRNDKTRKRVVFSELQLDEWRYQERTALQTIFAHGIEFSVLGPDDQQEAADLLKGIRGHAEARNFSCVEDILDWVVADNDKRLETMLVLDADRTLCADDTGAMFWEIFAKNEQLKDPSKEPFKDPLKAIFSSSLGYSFDAFVQADLLNGTVCDGDTFQEICTIVSRKVVLHPEFKKTLRRVKEDSHVGAVIVTCGVRYVWELVLELNGFSESVKVIGAGGCGNDYVVTAEIKAALVKRLQEKYGMYVWAFGDSPLDLPMLKQADEAIVVVGEKGRRSRTMEKELENSIKEDGLVARQLLLPSHASPRLDVDELPLFDIRDPQQLDSIFIRRVPLQIRHASQNAASLLQTPMRDGKISGVVLQEVHKKVGWFLATELVTEVLPLEEYDIDHVQGGSSTGHRLKHEDKTIIIALMRGGEPMAKGVHEAFPLALFLHANSPHDVEYHHLSGVENVLIVDSVINNGTTIVQFVRRIKEVNAEAKIVVMTGVAQKASVAENGPLARVGRDGLAVVALRLSENKYTGMKGTDTGNRLFNTCHLE